MKRLKRGKKLFGLTLNWRKAKGEDWQRIREYLQGGWLVPSPRTLCGANQSILVLLLHLHVKGHQLCGIMLKTCRDAVPHFPDLVDDRITKVLFHRYLQGVPGESPTLARRDRACIHPADVSELVGVSLVISARYRTTS